jgi:hypothetical protein
MGKLHEIYKKYMLYCDKGDRSSIEMYGHNYLDAYCYHFDAIRLVCLSSKYRKSLIFLYKDTYKNT